MRACPRLPATFGSFHSRVHSFRGIASAKVRRYWMKAKAFTVVGVTATGQSMLGVCHPRDFHQYSSTSITACCVARRRRRSSSSRGKGCMRDARRTIQHTDATITSLSRSNIVLLHYVRNKRGGRHTHTPTTILRS